MLLVPMRCPIFVVKFNTICEIKAYSVRIPRRWLALQQQAVGLSRSLREQYNRQPTDSELAAALAISLSEWQEIKLAWINRAPLSLDVPIQDGEEGLYLFG